MCLSLTRRNAGFLSALLRDSSPKRIYARFCFAPRGVTGAKISLKFGKFRLRNRKLIAERVSGSKIRTYARTRRSLSRNALRHCSSQGLVERCQFSAGKRLAGGFAASIPRSGFQNKNLIGAGIFNQFLLGNGQLIAQCFDLILQEFACFDVVAETLFIIRCDKFLRPKLAHFLRHFWRRAGEPNIHQA